MLRSKPVYVVVTTLGVVLLAVMGWYRRSPVDAPTWLMVVAPVGAVLLIWFDAARRREER